MDATVTFGSAAELGMCQDGLMSIGSKRGSFGVQKVQLGICRVEEVKTMEYKI